MGQGCGVVRARVSFEFPYSPCVHHINFHTAGAEWAPFMPCLLYGAAMRRHHRHSDWAAPHTAYEENRGIRETGQLQGVVVLEARVDLREAKRLPGSVEC